MKAMHGSWVLAAAAIAACEPTPAERLRPGASVAPAAEPDPDDDFLPPPDPIRAEDAAGPYWAPMRRACDECVPPAAIVAYVAPDEAAARVIVDALEGTLAPGLPYVAFTEELGARAPAPGIAIVTGGYTARTDAAAAARSLPAIEGTSAAVLDIALADRRRSPRHVTVVDRGAPVPAWRKADVDAVMAARDPSQDPYYLRELLDALDDRTPLCTVAPGELFVAGHAELTWLLAPVRCGAAPAYIAWTSSLTETVVIRRGTEHRLRQTLGFECDAPTVEEWGYTAAGRVEVEQRATPCP